MGLPRVQFKEATQWLNYIQEVVDMTTMELAFRKAKRKRKRMLRSLINKTLNALSRARNSGLSQDWIRYMRYKSRIPTGLQRLV